MLDSIADLMCRDGSAGHSYFFLRLQHFLAVCTTLFGTQLGGLEPKHRVWHLYHLMSGKNDANKRFKSWLAGLKLV